MTDVPMEFDVVPNIDGYDKVPRAALERMAAGGDESAQYELERRQPPPPGAPDPDMPPEPAVEGAPAVWGDAVVNDEPYWRMGTPLLRNLVADGDRGAMEELERRGLTP